ncbi:MAG: iron chaperone [Stenotrophomonas sp.]
MASKSNGFTAAEQAAMKERARELKAEAKTGKQKAEGEAELLAKVAEMPAAEQQMARRLHAIVSTVAPSLLPKTWYGMPAYARDGKVVLFFQGASKFGARYSTLGFNDTAMLDDGPMWATAYALAELTPEVEKKITALVKKAMRARGGSLQ